MTIQQQINARPNPGPSARFCPFCGRQLGFMVSWVDAGETLYKSQCLTCGEWFTNTAVLRWGG